MRAEYPNLLFLLALEWVVHFWHCAQFGIYEDDWFFNAGPYVWGAGTWFDLMQRQMASFVFGRPVEILLLYTDGYVGAALDSFEVLYVIAYLYWALATVLLYFVLRNRYSPAFSLLAATLFVLSPLTSVRQFLNTAYKMAPAYVLVFAGMWLYFRRRARWSYVLAGLSLFTYEWLFLLFFGAPLLDRDSPLISRRTLRHVVICGLILAAAVGLRFALHESRLAGQTPGIVPLVRGIVEATFVHGVNIPLLIVNGAYLGVMNFNWVALFFGLCAAVAFLVLYRRAAASSIELDWRAAARTILTGACFTMLGLALTYMASPDTQLGEFKVLGRITRIFGPAEFGVAIALAGCWSAVEAAARGFRPVVRLLFGGFIVVLVLFQFMVQSDYTAAWAEQKQLAARVMRLTPDADRETTILLRLHYHYHRFFDNENRMRAIGEEKSLLNRLFSFLHQPGEPAPSIYFIYAEQWRNYLKPAEADKLRWKGSFVPDLFGFARRPLTPGDVIYIYHSKDGGYARINDLIFIGETTLTKTYVPSSESAWSRMQPSRLFHHMFPDGAPVQPVESR